MTTSSGAKSETHLYDLPILERMHDHNVPGVSIAITAGTRIVEQMAYGVRTADEDQPVTTTTRFQACSISKPVTALAMLRLVERGMLDLDADVNQRLVSWQVPPNGDWQPRVTLRQLASHSAGLTTHGFPGYSRGAPLPNLVQILSGVAPANTEGVRADIVPGVQFRYSGGGTTVMQLLLEEATRMRLAELTRELVLAPLGMAHSGYEQPLPQPLREVAATAHTSDGRPVRGGWHVYPEQAAAGLWTTPADLAQFAIAIQLALRGAPDSLISADSAAQMLTPQTPLASAAERLGRLNGVGLGPFVRSVGGRTTYFGHSGSNAGFRCHLLAHSDRGHGAAVMTNGDGGMPIIMDAFRAIATAREWDDYEAEAPDDLPPDGEELDGFTGRYELASGTRVNVTRDRDRIEVVIGGQPPIPFSGADTTTIRSQCVDLTLTMSEGGDLVMHQGGVESVCRRIAE